MPASPPQPSPLSADQVTRVLRYWLRALRYQEALTARPKARQSGLEARPTGNLAEPTPGQDYAKLPLAGAESFLVEQHGPYQRALDNEGLAFFEHWLVDRYRGGEAMDQVQHLVLFPTLLLPRGDLAGLLRFEVKVQFTDADKRALAVPSSEQRAKKVLPTMPSHLSLTPIPAAEDSLPYFVDGRTLRDNFGVQDEQIDAFFTRLRSTTAPSSSAVVRALCELLESSPDAPLTYTSEPSPDSSVAAPSAPSNGPASTVAQGTAQLTSGSTVNSEASAALLRRLSLCCEARLRAQNSKVRAFPVALLVSSATSRATWHVQRDLERSLELCGAPFGVFPPALHAYLRGGEQLHAGTNGLGLGRLTERGLTSNQRGALEAFLDSTLCAVQGPPGTGKTTVIGNAFAHALVEHVAPLLKNGPVSDACWVVTSTNNKAVDNVMDLLRRGFPQHSLPLALRIGSRAVLEKITAPELERCKRWLDVTPFNEAEYTSALETFRTRYSAFEAHLASNATARVQARRAQSVRELLAGLDSGATLELYTRQVDSLLASALPQQDAKQALPSDKTKATRLTRPGALSELAGALGKRLRALSKLAESKPPAALEKHYKKTQSGALRALNEALAGELQLGLPPAGPSPSATDWEEAVEECLAWLTDLELALDNVHQVQEQSRQRAALQQELRELEDQPVVALTPPEEAQCYALFQAALDLHHMWTLQNKAPLVKSLALAIGIAKSTRSLRRLMEASGGTGAWLRRLFPAWGCTLLSLGNNFPQDTCIKRVIIDEAGQCHPAYAVSALLRAESALIIGDVHQLEPVNDLSAEDERRMCRGAHLALEFEGADAYRVHENSTASAQRLADRAVAVRHILVDHFRCQPEIAAISDALCNYGLTIHTRPVSRHAQVPELSRSVLLEAVAGEQTPHAGSWANNEEVNVTIDWLKRLLRGGIDAGDIAVITPFRGQLAALTQALRGARIPYEQEFQSQEDDAPSLFGPANGRVALGTVHRFQGGERSIVLFTTAVTRTTSLRFLDERVNLLNVAVSRARDHLITIGHEPTLRAGTLTRLLIPEGYTGPRLTR